MVLVEIMVLVEVTYDSKAGRQIQWTTVMASRLLAIQVDELRKKALDKYEAEKYQAYKQSFMKSVRERIKDASNIKTRPAWDLHEEERCVVYRKLIQRLMLDSWSLPGSEDNRHLSHVRSTACCISSQRSVQPVDFDIAD